MAHAAPVVIRWPAHQPLPPALATLVADAPGAVVIESSEGPDALLEWTGNLAEFAGPALPALRLAPTTDSDHLLTLCRWALRLQHLAQLLDSARLATAQWRQAALTDPITGLRNRRGWDEQLAAAPSPAPPGWALILLDLDNFKAVNAQFGLAHGDLLLAQVGRQLAHQTAPEEIVARWGGDEFAIAFPCDSAHAAALRATQWQRAAAIPASPLRPAITASTGWAWSALGLPPRELFPHAEAALRAAKSLGRNRLFPAV
ncbi:MAG: GGDEF domain-containing protein [Pirellulales bacterium]